MSLAHLSARRVTTAACLGVATLVVALLTDRIATAQPSSGSSDPRLVAIDHPGNAKPVIQVALPPGMFADLRGLVDAALAGVVDALQADSGENRAATQQAAQHLGAIREVTQLLEGAIEEIRVEVYAGEGGELAVNLEAIANHYAEKLVAAGWDQVVRARDGDDGAHVFMLRNNGAVRGLFVVAGEHDNVALVNAACDVSPERLQNLTRRVTSLWLEVGGREQLAQGLQHMPH